MLKAGVWVLVIIFAGIAGWSDLRRRRIPNWLTVPGLVAGIVANSVVSGWPGARSSLLGAGLGLGLLLPFVLIRSFGAGDWKLVGAMGALLGTRDLIVVLAGTVVVNAVIALFLVVWKKRVRQTLRNIGLLAGSLISLRMPAPELSIDHPEALKVPFGVAMGITTIVYGGSMMWRMY
jgi:prepilin peptidase CpaA